MAMTGSIQFDPAQLREVDALLSGIAKGADKAMSRAITRTTDTSRSRIVKAITANVNIAQKRLYAKGDRSKPVRQKFNRNGRLVTGAHIEVTGARVPITPQSFGAKQTRRGVTYRIDKQGGRKLIPSAFIATMPSGFEGAFKRRRDTRLPLDQLKGPSVPQVAEGLDEVTTLVKSEAGELLNKNLLAEVNYLLSRRRANG